MRAVVIQRFGGPEVLRVVELPAPSLAPDSVRIRVSASGVNFADVQMRMGLYPEAPRPPFVPGFEIAGVVTEVGSKVAKLKPGDRVLGLTGFGGYATEVVLPAGFVRGIPGHLTEAEAAAIPVAFITAWISLIDMARVRRGDRVLVPGAAGGVGTAAVQIAARSGAEVTGLVGLPSKKEFVLSLGAREAFTYEEWTGVGKGAAFDVVLEPRGGNDVRASLPVLAPAGRVVCYGVSSLVTGLRRSIPRTVLGLLRTPLFTPIGLQMANQGIFGLNMLRCIDTEKGREIAANALEKVLEGFEKRHYRAPIGKIWRLTEAAEAHAFLQNRQGTGKQILREEN